MLMNGAVARNAAYEIIVDIVEKAIIDAMFLSKMFEIATSYFLWM